MFVGATPRGSFRSMATGSSSSGVTRRRGPFIPTIPCPDCYRVVDCGVSGTHKHDGWVYYKCKTHGKGCNFWRWELEYVQFLVEKNILEDEAAVEAICWAEERREQLEVKKEEKEVGLTKEQLKMVEEMMLARVDAIGDVQKKMQHMLMIIGAMLCVILVGLVLLMIK